jgi:predicted ABC-type ATPase
MAAQVWGKRLLGQALTLGRLPRQRSSQRMRALHAAPIPPPRPAGAQSLQAVFTVGVPGSGKSRVLDLIFGWRGDRLLLDLDDEMKAHPSYDPLAPHLVYDSADAYAWADERVVRRFEAALSARAPHRLLVFDGTGTKVASRIARMEQARASGYVVSLVYVRVALDTALARNRARPRCVPEYVLQSYYERVARSFELLRPHADEVYVVDNDGDDDATEHLAAISLPHSASEGVQCLHPLHSRLIPRAVLREELDDLEGDEAAAARRAHALDRTRDCHGRVIVPLSYGHDDTPSDASQLLPAADGAESPGGGGGGAAGWGTIDLADSWARRTKRDGTPPAPQHDGQ